MHCIAKKSIRNRRTKKKKNKTERRKKYPRGVMVKSLDCGIVVSGFELQLRYYVYFRTKPFGKVMNLPDSGLILPLLSF